ncbi:(R)-mandelonitrile lyase [Marinospirillum perlucidum]|uniref:(R)-mandelonitrile lyase n=1 Tax=Marinospirillum perlucidum TaxID=1982602 RepID=UPI000DF3DCBC|nr:cupin domain-containing protein [Marinospirillum perlucidum]
MQDKQTLQVRPPEEQESFTGPEDYFTGSVTVKLLHSEQAPSRTSAGSVTFQPGARTAWHQHPLGQLLIVTQGKGWLQQEGGSKKLLLPGDSAWIPPHVKHWHGASEDQSMTHLAIQESQDATSVTWLEKVSDEDYQGQS